MNMQPVFAKCDFISACDGEKSIGQKLFENGICLPSDTKMTEEEQNAVIDVIKRLF